jgi:hypothetical protein
LALARDFMPLSTPESETKIVERSETRTEQVAFLRALLIFIGEVSKPRPFDQAKPIPPPPTEFPRLPQYIRVSREFNNISPLVSRKQDRGVHLTKERD